MKYNIQIGEFNKMKIYNIDVEQFLKGTMRINREKSKKNAGKKPSNLKKHIKQPERVIAALADLEKNHNWSWSEELKYRNKDNLDKEAIFYRGNSISAREMFQNAENIAKSLDKIGIKKGDEILACMSNTPEAIYLLEAAAMCGAVVHFIGSGFEQDYLNEIVNSKKRKVFFGTDNEYEKIEEIVGNSSIENKVLVSLTDSLPNGEDPYAYYDNDFYKFENKVPIFKERNPEIMTFKEFIEIGKDHVPQFADINMDDELTITYTSGSTKTGRPKAISHAHRTYMSIARAHDPDISRMPAMRNMRGLAHIPLHSNTDISSSISDPLMQTCSVACEPIYNERFLTRSLLINETAFAPATRSQWIRSAKDYHSDSKVAGKKLPFLVNVVSVGEGTNKNEENFINSWFREIEAGCKALPRPLSPIKLSLGGGNCEHGGLFFTLFHHLRQKIAITKDGRKDYGLTPFQIVDMAVLREDGTECDFDEYGKLVANSPCTMLGYKNNEEATQKFFYQDATGKIWGDCNVWAYIGKNGNVRIKGRYDDRLTLSTGAKVPTFLVNETVENDVKNILSVETVIVDSEIGPVLVSHIELLPDSKMSVDEILADANERCIERFQPELADKILFRVRGNNESFPLTGSLKRSTKALEKEGLDKTIKPIRNGQDILLIDGETYTRKQDKNYKVRKKCDK